jgi:hypothetical protein
VKCEASILPKAVSITTEQQLTGELMCPEELKALADCTTRDLVRNRKLSTRSRYVGQFRSRLSPASPLDYDGTPGLLASQRNCSAADRDGLPKPIIGAGPTRVAFRPHTACRWAVAVSQLMQRVISSPTS